MPDIIIPTRENQFENVAIPPPPSRLPWYLLAISVVGLGGALGFSIWLITDERAKAAQITDTHEQGAKELQALQTRVRSLEGEVKDKQDELSKLKTTYDDLQDKMKAEINRGDIKLTESGGKLQVDLVDKILFDSGQAELSPRGQEVLARLGGVLAKIDNRQLQVSGHTDDSPPTDRIKDKYPTNWELSTARAVTVVRFLGDKAGVPQKRMLAAGYGQFHPVANNANGDGRARNRRIEILLTPMLDAKQTSLAAKAPAKSSPTTVSTTRH